MIHQLALGRNGYGTLGITLCPEWHNTVVFIAWIEENTSPRPGQVSDTQRIPCLHAVYTLDRVDNDQINYFRVRFRRSETSICAVPEALGNLGLAFGRTEHKIRDLSA